MLKPTNKRRATVVLSLLVVATFAAYWPVLNNDFITYDDGSYVTDNPHVKAGITGEGIAWAFTTGHSGNWHPLTWLTHMLDSQLYGLNPMGHHLTNLLLHIANSLLLFLLFRQMTNSLWQSAFVAAVFALHPLHVESVAWASERKDVLSALFWILTIWAYVRYVEHPEIKRYLLALSFLALGLLSKPMLVTLPLVLFLLDYWPLGRIQIGKVVPILTPKNPQRLQEKVKGTSVSRLVREKIPFLLLAVASSVITFIVQQRGGAVAKWDSLPIHLRVTNALAAYVQYIGKTIWPSNLAFFYPHPAEHLPVWQAAAAGLALLFLSGLVIWLMRRRPYLPVGWFWYTGTLVPVIGLVQVGMQSMADRYMYVPMIGIVTMIAWGIPELVEKMPARKNLLAILTGISLVAMGGLTFSQVRYWRDSITLYEHAIKVTEHNWVAYGNLGLVLAQQGRNTEAIAQYNKALENKPDNLDVRRLLAFVLVGEGRVDEAMAQYAEALRIKPDDAESHNNLGSLLARQGKINEALAHYFEAVRISPEYTEAHYNLGFYLAQQGKTQEAIAHYSEALRIKPDYAEARLNLGNLLVAQGRMNDAIAHYSDLTRFNPNYDKGHYVLGFYLAGQGKIDEAIAHYSTALQINPSYPEVHYYLGQALARQGKAAEAVAHFSEAVRLRPGYLEARAELERAQRLLESN